FNNSNKVKEFVTVRELFLRHPEIKKQLWGDGFLTSGYYAKTVGLYGSGDVIMAYVSNQGNEKKYKKLYDGQFALFD
ncbi:MAG TPA: transposase, partial [Paludibacteraceae bacterium]|nr:transposase [Paludibacteraceae bacterium]